MAYLLEQFIYFMLKVSPSLSRAAGLEVFVIARYGGGEASIGGKLGVEEGFKGAALPMQRIVG